MEEMSLNVILPSRGMLTVGCVLDATALEAASADLYALYNYSIIGYFEHHC